MDEDKIITEIINIKSDSQIIKEEVTGLKNNMGQVLYSLDGMTQLMKKLDQEYTFGTERFNRLEETTEKHEKDLKKIKAQLKPA